MTDQKFIEIQTQEGTMIKTLQSLGSGNWFGDSQSDSIAIEHPKSDDDKSDDDKSDDDMSDDDMSDDDKSDKLTHAVTAETTTTGSRSVSPAERHGNSSGCSDSNCVESVGPLSKCVAFKKFYKDRIDKYNNNTFPEMFQHNEFKYKRIRFIRENCAYYVNHPIAADLILFLVILNCITITISTSDFVQDDPTTLKTFDTIDTVLLSIFTFESLLQLAYHGPSLLVPLSSITPQGFLTFDIYIVIVSWAVESLSIARALRVLRAVRILKQIEALNLLIQAMIETLPSLGSITALLLLVFYIFAVMFTTLFKELPLSDHYFKRIDFTFFTLFQIMSMDWSEIAREVAVYKPWSPLLFSLFVILSGFIFYNMIIAVLCETLTLLEKKRMEGQVDEKKERMLRLEDMCKELKSNQETMRLLLNEMRT